MKFRIVFANMYQGMHFAGEQDGTDLFFGYRPSLYLELFKKLNPDVLCLAEVPFDSQEGGGDFQQELENQLGFTSSRAYVSDKSWIVEGKFYGSAIYSKFKLADYSVETLPNPKLETIRPDGSHWVMHDKAVQKAVFELGSKKLNVFNLHYYPFHHFGRSLREDEFAPIRRQLAKLITPQDGELSLVAGDFNNKGVQFSEAFPELLEDESFSQAITYDRRKVEKLYEGDGTQVDHILFSSGLKLLHSEVHDNFSDHASLVADFEIT